jgi:AraC-like DNA-binding protein
VAARDDHRSHVLATPWPGVQLVQIDSARHFPRHWHANFGVGLVERGAHRSASGRGPVDAHAGDLITHNPGEVHDGQPLGAPRRRWRMVHLDTAALRSALALPAGDTALDRLEITRPVLHDPLLGATLHGLFASVEAWARERSGDNGLACDEQWTRTCGLLLARHASEPVLDLAAQGAVQRARERLADDSARAPSLAELAAEAGLSKFQLLRRFAQAYGLPPHAWLLQQRTERARRLIAAGHTLADAAATAGFADQGHMTRHFVRHFGFTPGAFRAATLQ